MKRRLIAIIALVVMATVIVAGCSEASRVSYNLSKEADNFNVVRELTVIDCITGEILFQMSGRMSITADTADNQLEIIVEYDDDSYVKRFVGLSDNVTYIVEDLNLGENEVSKYQYALNLNPKMWSLFNAEYID